MMKDLLFWLLPLIVVVLFVVKSLGQVSGENAAALLKKGAVVIDVRGPGEFASDHIDGAINLPLGELEQRIAGAVPEKSTPVLVHCLSGTRSAIAARKLKHLGYPAVHNLGSLGRARGIISAAR